MHEVENFFANFQILGPLGCLGWVFIPQNVKKVKITAPYCVFIYIIKPLVGGNDTSNGR
jgi:hypothetical protein